MVLLIVSLTLVLACLGVLMALGGMDHGHLVADRPWRIPGTGLFISSAVYQWVVPLVLTFTFWWTAKRVSSTPVLVLLSFATSSALVAVWLFTLVRHDCILSLLHGGVLVWVLWLVLRCCGVRWSTHAMILVPAGAIIAVVSYGAIRGEARCDEKTDVGCHVTTGPRVWAPGWLASIGVPTFADLRDADLRGIDLRGRDLRYADLRGADLRDANLSGSNLRRATVDGIVAVQSTWRDAYLDGATLTGADLTGADLQGIHAYRVDLRGADLTDANLRGASLSHAFVAGARLNGATLQGAYLRFVEGLVVSQLDDACGDERTLPPKGFSIKSCPGE